MVTGNGPFLVEEPPRMRFHEGLFYIENTVNGEVVKTVYRPHMFVRVSKEANKLVEQFFREQANAEDDH